MNRVSTMGGWMAGCIVCGTILFIRVALVAQIAGVTGLSTRTEAVPAACQCLKKAGDTGIIKGFPSG